MRRAARREGVSVSEFMRRATAERTERTLSVSARERLGDVVGAIHSDAAQARRTGTAFADVLAEQRRARR